MYNPFKWAVYRHLRTGFYVVRRLNLFFHWEYFCIKRVDKITIYQPYATMFEDLAVARFTVDELKGNLKLFERV